MTIDLGAPYYRRKIIRYGILACAMTFVIAFVMSLCNEWYFDFSTGMRICKLTGLHLTIWTNQDNTLVPKMGQAVSQCNISFKNKPTVLYKRAYVFSSSRIDNGFGDVVFGFESYFNSVAVNQVSCQDLKTISNCIDRCDSFLVLVDDQGNISVQALDNH